MEGMTHGREYHPAFPIIVGPAGNRLRAVIFESQPVDVLAAENDVLGVFVVGNVVLFVRYYEFLDSLGNGVLGVRHDHLEWSKSRVADIRPTHYFPEILGVERNVTAVVKHIKAIPSKNEILDGFPLLFSNLSLGLGFGPVITVFQVTRVWISVRPQIPVGPDHAVAETDEKLIAAEEVCRHILIINREVDRQAQHIKKPGERHADEMRIVLAVADERQRSGESRGRFLR